MNISDPNAVQNLEETPVTQEQIEPQNKKPQRAPLILRVGVTGHRTVPDDLPIKKRKRPVPNIPAIRATIKEVLEVIRISFKGVVDTNGDLFDLTPTGFQQTGGDTLRIISALASGADQWVADEATKLGFELQAILPFDRDEYLKDFAVQSDANLFLEFLSKATAVLELDGKVSLDDTGKRKPDEQAYVAVGHEVIHQSDLLIAIWDGKDTYRKGGTGQVVRRALRNGTPVVWIPWSTPDKWRLGIPPIRLNEKTANLFVDRDGLSEIIRKLIPPPAEERKLKKFRNKKSF